MTTYLALTINQVKETISIVKRSKPAYSELLEFYGALFHMQEESKIRVQLDPIHISNELRAIKAKERLPLIDTSGFIWDSHESIRLFMAICQLAEKTNPKLAESASVILTGEFESALDGLFSGLLHGNESIFDVLSVELGIEKQILSFLVYNSLKPSVLVCAGQLAAYLKNREPWQSGYCPICGNEPILSILNQEGERNLVCRFCWHLWSARRVYCPYCTSTHDKDLHYFYNEEGKGARVDCCENCKKYIKTIDIRKMDRLIYPPLEHISRLHLDIKSQDLGFKPGIELFI
jgi:FdhE protein